MYEICEMKGMVCSVL